MKSNILQLKAALIALALVGSLSSCKDEDAGPYIEKTVNLTEYTQLEIRGAMEVVISPDYAFDLRIEAPDNVMPSIEIVQSGNRLIIDEGNHDVDNYRIVVKISEDHLDYIEFSGSGNLVTDTIFATNLEVLLSGSGLIESIVSVEELDAEISGSGQLQFYGMANTTDFVVGGSGYLDAKSVEATSSVAHIDGSGAIDLYASEYLFARIDGSGLIRYWGNPVDTNLNVDGSGQILKMN